MRRAYIFNMMILLLPALIVGGALAASGDTSDGLKLLLSLLGCGLIYQAIKQSHQPLLKMVGNHLVVGVLAAQHHFIQHLVIV